MVVAVDNLVPVFQGALEDAAFEAYTCVGDLVEAKDQRRAIEKQGGTAHKNIDPPEILLDLLDGPINIFPLGDTTLVRLCLYAKLFRESILGLLNSLLVGIVPDRHIGTCFCHCFCDCETDS